MSTIEIMEGALSLPEDLVAELVGSLPVVLSDVDDGSLEARRRLKEDPSVGRSWDQIKRELGR